MGATPGRNIAPIRRTQTLNGCDFDHDSDLVRRTRLGDKTIKTPCLRDCNTWIIRLYRLVQLLSVDFQATHGIPM